MDAYQLEQIYQMRQRNKMTATRQQEIIVLVDAWKQDTGCYTKDALFALYDDRMITGAELDQLMPNSL